MAKEAHDNDTLTELEINKSAALRKILTRIMALVLVLAFIPLAFSGVLRLLHLPSLGFLIESRELSREPFADSAKDAIVAVRAGDRRGTGFNIDPEGIIVTNYHILEDDETAEISWRHGENEIVRKILAWPEVDLVLLAADGTDLPFLELEISELPDPGDEIYLIGNPLGLFQITNRAEFLGLTLVSGHEMPVIKLRGPVYRGSSGSPLINSESKVIGIVFAKSDSAADNSDITGYAITAAEIDKLKNALSDSD